MNPDDLALRAWRDSVGSFSVFHITALRESMRQKGLEQVKKFRWEKTVRETLALYEKVMREA